MGISSQVYGIVWLFSYSDFCSSYGDEEDDELYFDKVVILLFFVLLSYLLLGSYVGYILIFFCYSVGSQMVSFNGILLDNYVFSYVVS